MIRTTIFDIPIYSMSEECFNKKWDEAVASKIQNYDQLKNTGFFYPKCVWKYNYIIGHVEISVSYDTVWFDVYLVNMKHLPFLSEKNIILLISMSMVCTSTRLIFQMKCFENVFIKYFIIFS